MSSGCRARVVSLGSEATLYVLRLFGGVALEGPEGPLDGRIVQRRQLALLALLGAAPAGGASRDWLTARLWPEATGARAPRLLSDTLYVVRHELGEGSVRVSGEDLRLDPDVIDCDVIAFQEALSRGEKADALRVYRGPFLDGFHATDSREFDLWQQRTELRLRRRAKAAARELSATAEATGDLEGALRWERRRGEIDPYDEASLRRRLVLLDLLGDVPGALQEYRSFRSDLAVGLGIEPGSETRSLARELRSRTASVEQIEPSPGRPATDRSRRVGASPPREASTEPPRVAYRRPASTAAALLATVILGAAIITTVNRHTPGVGAKSVAVLPFANLTGNPDDAYLSAGFTNNLASRLSGLDDLRVSAPSALTRGALGSAGDDEPAGQWLVDCLLEGDVQRAGDSLRVSVRLVDVSSGENLWADVYDGSLDGLFGLQAAVARGAAATLTGSLTDEEARRFALEAGPASEAYNLYLRARWHYHRRDREGLERAVALLERSIRLDPDYAPAHAALADALLILGSSGHWPADSTYVRMRESIRRALALDPHLAQAHASLSGLHVVRREWVRAVAANRRAIELDPSYALAHHWLAHELLTGFGRHEEALEAKRTAHRLDPLSPIIALSLGWHHYLMGHFEQTVEFTGRALEIDPAFAGAHAQLARAKAHLGDFDGAIAAIEEGLARRPESRGRLLAERAYVEALLGSRNEARRLIGEARRAGTRPSSVALAYAALGARDSTMRWLDSTLIWLDEARVFRNAYDVHGIRWDPVVGPLRNDSGYRARMDELRRRWSLE